MPTRRVTAWGSGRSGRVPDPSRDPGSGSSCPSGSPSEGSFPPVRWGCPCPSGRVWGRGNRSVSSVSSTGLASSRSRTVTVTVCGTAPAWPSGLRTPTDPGRRRCRHRRRSRRRRPAWSRASCRPRRAARHDALAVGHRVHAGAVEGEPLPHRPQIRVGVVVAQHRGVEVAGASEVAASGAQVVAGGQRSVEHVVRVADAVLVAVRTPAPPGRRKELHRTHRPVEDRVPVQGTAVAVADQREPDAVESRAGDPPARGPVGGDGTAPGVPRLHLADRGEKLPRQTATGVRPGHRGLGRPVRPQDRRGDTRLGPEHGGHRGRRGQVGLTSGGSSVWYESSPEPPASGAAGFVQTGPSWSAAGAVRCFAPPLTASGAREAVRTASAATAIAVVRRPWRVRADGRRRRGADMSNSCR